MSQKAITTAQYVRELFEESLITGVPQIILTRNTFRKVLKTVVLSCCLIGFVYQTTEFLKIFWSYPTVLDIDVEYPEVIESPAITFCNLNGIKRTRFCEAFPGRCTYPTDRRRFCGYFPNTCNIRANVDLKFPLGDALNSEMDLSNGYLDAFGHSANETLSLCRKHTADGDWLKDCGHNKTIRMLMSDGSSGHRNCHTLFSSIGATKLNQYTIPVPKRKEALFHMMFDLEIEEYFRPDREFGVIVSIHSPNSLINPFYEGFVIKPGRLYTVHLKMVEEKLLPSPYETKCQDYKSMWLMRGGQGPLSQEMCVAECVFNVSMKQCSCVVPDIMYFHKERICTDEELDECFHFNISECYTFCHQPCEFTDFEYAVQERKLEDSTAHSIEDLYQPNNILMSKAVMLIFLKRPEIIIYSHRPQYEDIEVFSFMGGYVGMWLGVSFVAVFELLENIFLVTFFWIRKKIS